MKLLKLKRLLTPVLSALQYYRIKARIKQSLFYHKLIREDEKEKRRVESFVYGCHDKVEFGRCSLVVSLTSYGKRIADSLPYTLFSLITQDLLPERIDVYIANNEYKCTSELPEILQHISNIGVNFHFVDDLRSYKKLIFSLKDFPCSPILTVDDDMIYHPDFIRSFWSSYLDSDGKTVLGSIGRYEQFSQNGTYLPYSQWIDCRKMPLSSSSISFYGCGGCLYPPSIFDDEIFNVEVFQKLAPFADDLWFWAMEKRAGIKCELISQEFNALYHPVNRIDMYKKESTLTYQNDDLRGNDSQLENLIDYYHLDNRIYIEDN